LKSLCFYALSTLGYCTGIEIAEPEWAPMDEARIVDQDGAERAGDGRAKGDRNGVQRRIPGINSRSRKPRSAITSGRALFNGGDPNSAWSRRYADLLADHVSDAGGMEWVSAAKFSLIRRITSLECEIERLEARLSRGDDVDLDAFGRACSHLRRLFEAIGIERRAKDVTPTLNQYLDDKYGQTHTDNH
jgi:hypothetical protein